MGAETFARNEQQTDAMCGPQPVHQSNSKAPI
jgi:hypothetical protein